MEDRDLKIMRMQNNLGALRKIAGWTTEQLANKLDVSKQTVCNLENKENHTKMKYSQYALLKMIFDEEIKNNLQNELLEKAMDVLINEPDPDENKYNEKELYIDTLASAKYAGKSNEELAKFMALMCGMLAVPVVGQIMEGTLGMGKLFDMFFTRKFKQ